jgi:signal peptidase I
VEFNLALILTSLTAISGAVVAYNYFYYRDHVERSGRDVPSGMAVLIEYSRSFFPVLLFVLVIRSFIFEPFRIPSGSMMPTLTQGDYIFVKKYQYGLRLPVLETKIIETGEPERGDVVVFRLPSNPSINYIKRVVGLPGDKIEYRRHRLFVNGVLVHTVRDEEQPLDGKVPRFTESLDERQHAVLLEKTGNRPGDGSYTVPEGHYFMMGDNRDRSKDSRFIGAIPETHLVGEAVRIWMHMDGLEWPDWGRIGTKIQ